MPFDGNVDFPEKLQPLFEPARYKVLHGGRGGAKSWGIARALLIEGVSKPGLRVLCVREFQTSMAESVHKLLSDQIIDLGLSDQYEVQKDYIFGPWTSDGTKRTQFAFYGIKNNIDKIKSFEGVDRVWAEEADKVSESSWKTLIPTIRKNDSEIWISFNPHLRKDYTYKHFVVSPRPDSIVIEVNYWDNPWFPPVLQKEMENCKEEDFDEYLHIWCGKCKQVLTGAVYAKEIQKVILEGRLGRVPYQCGYGVSTYWDLGLRDMTSIWFVQFVGFQTLVIDFYENRGEDMEHYIMMLQNRGYTYDMHWLPHDGTRRGIMTKKTPKSALEAKGYKGKVRVVPRAKPYLGISAGRTLFSRCYFDEAKITAPHLDGMSGWDRLGNYRYKIDDGEYANLPLHDDNSNAADAFRTLAMSTNEPRKKGSQRLYSGDEDAPGPRSFREKVMALRERLPGPQGWMSQ